MNPSTSLYINTPENLFCCCTLNLSAENYHKLELVDYFVCACLNNSFKRKIWKKNRSKLRFSQRKKENKRSNKNNRKKRKRWKICCFCQGESSLSLQCTCTNCHLISTAKTQTTLQGKGRIFCRFIS